MNKLLLGTALLLSTAITTTAFAGPKWNQASVSYLSASSGDDETSGFGVSGSKLLGSHFFVVGSYASFSEDISGTVVDVDTNFLSLGLGARKAVAASTDLYGIISYENAELALSSGLASAALDDVNGYSGTVGVRSMVTPKFELSAAANYTKFDDESESGFNVGAAFHFTNQFALGVGYGTSGDVDTLSLNGTINF